MSNITLREVTEDDLPFIYNSWMKSSKRSVEQVKKLVAVSKIKIAEDEVEKLIISWCATFEDKNNCIVLYLYTKQAFRKLGIANMLLEASTNGFKRVFCACPQVLSLLKTKELINVDTILRGTYED